MPNLSASFLLSASQRAHDRRSVPRGPVPARSVAAQAKFSGPLSIEGMPVEVA